MVAVPLPLSVKVSPAKGKAEPPDNVTGSGHEPVVFTLKVPNALREGGGIGRSELGGLVDLDVDGLVAGTEKVDGRHGDGPRALGV